jgi:7-cyano-7-deazaguanine synthase in queuosine biosynthesis|tara:strand:- start:213 stop:1010 length:798 start_codon:yes stop_codon:yes gene_type:complete
MRGKNLEGYYKNPPVPKDADSIVNVSGGIECFASLWWAKENGLNPIALHLYNNPNNHPGKDAQLFYAKKQADFFGFPLIVEYSHLPAEVSLALMVNMYVSACTMLLLGNPRDWKYMVWGGNSEDSLLQRLQLRYPTRAYLAESSFQLDLHGISGQRFMKAPLQLFPFEMLTKSEVLSMVAKNKTLWEFASKNTWYCYPSLRDRPHLVEKIKIAKLNGKIVGYKRCGECPKCKEYDNAVQVTNKSYYKQQEGTFEKRKPKQEWIDE